MGAVIRPNVPWGKAVFLSGDKGNNGKGTICRLLRNLCGDGNWANIPLENFGKDFMLEKLIGATANIVDENDVGGYLERAADFKAVVTGDPIQINRKNRRPVEYTFKGLTVQCLNDKPRVQDSSDSFYRRCLVVPFEYSFTGRERKYIKYDYMGRREVLEYVLNRVLNMDYEELMEPAACRQALGLYKISNDPVRQWWDEVFDRFTWDLLPWKFLYQCYVNWFRASNPSGRVQSRNSFIDKMRAIAEQDTIWEYPGRGPDGKDIQISAAGRISGDEELAMKYYLPNYDMHYKEAFRLGSASNWLGDSNKPKKHRGLIRRQTSPGQSAASGINTTD